MTDHAVVIAGAGPTGLMLAGELALAGVDVALVERREDQHLAGSRAGGLHSRTIELLDQRGIAERFLDEGQVAQVASFASTSLDISDFPTRHNYGLGIWQNQIERILAEWVGELDVKAYRGREIIGLRQTDNCVDVQMSDGLALRSQYLVGCDGGRSFVRKAAGFDFPGWNPTLSSLIAEVEVTQQPILGIHSNEFGTHAFGREKYEVRDGEIIFADTGPVRVMVTEPTLRTASDVTLDDLSEALIAVFGTDYGVHNPTWISRFTDMTRQAATYRSARVLLAGDAAHIHSPIGGQGLNLGLHDAVNLGWKLAQVAKGVSPNALLDTYHNERHPIGARVLRDSMAQVALGRPEERARAAREIMAELLTTEEARKSFAARMSGLDIHYDLGEGHPLLGRRVPDLDLVTQAGPIRVYHLLHAACPLLLNLGEEKALSIDARYGRVNLIDASYHGRWELPAIGCIEAPEALLIRPDGYVAWVGDRTQAGLPEALTKWFGPGFHSREIAWA